MKQIALLLYFFSYLNNAFSCTATMSPNQTLCFEQGNTYTVSFTGTGGTAPYTFSYKVNNGPTQTIQSDSSGIAQLIVPMSTQGYFNYVMTNVTDAAGCNQALNVSKYVFLQGAMIAFISGSTTVLQNSSPAPTILFNCNGGVPPIVFQYTVNGGGVQTITSNINGMAYLTVPTNQAGTFVYQLVGVQSSLSCSNSGTPNINPNPVTITVNPAPAFPTGSVSILGGCDHYTLSFQGSGGLTPNYSYTYTLNGVTQSVSGSANFSISGPSVSTTTTYTLSGVSVTNNGLTGPLSGSSSATVLKMHHATITGNASVCKNDAMPMITFTGSSGAPPYIFTYQINGGINQVITSGSSNSVSIPVSTATSGTFVYNLISVGSNSGCPVNYEFGTATITVSSMSSPTATINGTTSVCKNDAMPMVTFTGTGGTAPYTFIYKINGGANQVISSGSSNFATVAVPTTTTGNFVYTLVSVGSASGCSQLQTGSATVTVNSLPTASISGTTSVCKNAVSPTIFFYGYNGSSPYTFTYSVNGSASQTITTSIGNSVTLPVPTGVSGTFVYSLLSVSSGNGCSQSATGSVTITVKPLPVIISSENVTLCQTTGSTPVIFTGSNATAPYSITYNINGGPNQIISTGSGNTATFNVPNSISGVTTYNLIAASSNGCSATQNGSSTITVNSVPNGSINGSAYVCLNDTTPSLELSAAGASMPYVFTYNVNGGTIQTISSGSNGSVSLPVSTNNSGTFVYNLIGISSVNGCSQSNTGSAQIVVKPLPIIDHSTDVTICQSTDSTSVMFTGSNATAPYSITYNINGGPNQIISTGSGNTATFNVPNSISGVTTYNLIAASSNGCSVTQNGSSTITVNSVPNGSINGSAYVCLNDTTPSLELFAAGASVPYVFTYNVNGGTIQTISSGSNGSVSLPVSTNNSGTFVYNLIGISSVNGCSQSNIGSAQIVVKPLPIIDHSTDVTICQSTDSTSVMFTGSNATAPYLITYNINGGPNQTISTGSGNTATFNVSNSISGVTTYNLIAASSNGCSATQNGSSSIVVNETPFGNIQGTTTICENEFDPIIVFSGNSGTAPYTFQYLVNGAAYQIQSSGNLDSALIVQTGTTVGDFEYVLMNITDALGCSNLENDSVLVTIKALPNAQLSGTTIVCQNDNQPSITFNGSGGSGDYNFLYALNGGPNQSISSNGNASISLLVPTDSAGLFTYTLLAIEDLSGCSQVQSGNAIVEVTPTPFALINGNSTVCQNDASPIVDIILNENSGPYEVIYSINGVQQFDTTSLSLAIPVNTSVPGNFVYTLISVTNEQGCSNENVESATIVVNQTPDVPTITAIGDNSICSGASITLISSAVENIWSTGEISQSITVNLSGDYSVSQSSQGCLSQSSDTFSLVVNEPIDPVFSFSTVYCENDQLPDLPSTSLNGIIGTWFPSLNNTQTTTYLFTPADGECANTTNETIVINSLPTVSLIPIENQCNYYPLFQLDQGTPLGGVYTINGVEYESFDPLQFGAGIYNLIYAYTDLNGCAGVANTIINVDECLGIEESFDQEIQLFPNPSNGIFNIVLSTKMVTEVELIDAFGKIIFNELYDSQLITIDVSKFANGVYSVNLINFNGEWSSRIIKL